MEKLNATLRGIETLSVVARDTASKLTELIGADEVGERERRREGGREGDQEGGWTGGREGGREGDQEGGWTGGREGGRV